jgi:prepilin-type N-terminal cleavage/methylation domain-containing protein
MGKDGRSAPAFNSSVVRDDIVRGLSGSFYGTVASIRARQVNTELRPAASSMRFLFNINLSEGPRVGASRPTVRRSRTVRSLSFKYAAMNTKTQNGFTLLEFLVAVAVAGIVLGFGVPSFMEFQRNNALINAANEMVSGLYLARTEAVKRQVPVTLCGSLDSLVAVSACGVGGTLTSLGWAFPRNRI